MTKEDRDLLLKDLSSRVFYGCYIKFPKSVFLGDLEDTIQLLSIKNLRRISINLSHVDCFPYLRSLSSMTEEECRELGELPATIENVGETLPNVPYYIEVVRPEQIDWLNSHHFDYRGLIEKGLALEAPEDMYTKLNKL